MRVITILFFLVLTPSLFTSNRIHAQLSSALKREIVKTEKIYKQRKHFDERKMLRIEALKDELLSDSTSDDLPKQYTLNYQLYKEFFSFKSYEAFNASIVMYKIANQLNDDEQKTKASLCNAEVLMCLGLFNEAIDIINAIKKPTKGDWKFDYYRIMTRLYGDLKSYNDLPFFSLQYEQLKHAYSDSLLQMTNNSNVEYQMVSAIRMSDRGAYDEALQQCANYLDKADLSEHHKAMLYSSMAGVAARKNDVEAQIGYLLKSIRLDVQSSTYETTSSRVLSQVLLNNGEIELAHKFIIRAIEDAEFFGARQRKAENSHVLPIIESQLKEIQQLKMRSVLGIAASILISLLVILYLLLRLTKRHREVKVGNNKIKEQNTLLSKQNIQLSESNKIKEEYLTNYFELSSVYFHEIENMKDKVSSLLLQKKYAAISTFLNQQNHHDDKDRLFVRFDELFLNLFPTFIRDVNAVLNETVQLPEEASQEKLSAELRVFALFRLGISGADRIATVLGISRNTVYTYRNRIKTKVNMSPDEFDQYILNIPAY